MKTICLRSLGFLLLAACTSQSQTIEAFLCSYADAIVEETAFAFTEAVTGESFQSTQALEPNQHLAIQSEFLHWRYTSALVYAGLRELGEKLDKRSYVDFGDRAFQFFFASKPFHEKNQAAGYTIQGLENFGRFKGVWNDGAQMAALVDVYRDDPRTDYLEYMARVADFLFDYEKSERRRQEDLNVDQVYAKGVFMARWGVLMGNPECFDYCVDVVLELEARLYDPLTGLYDQYYYPQLNQTNKIKWLRGMGWAAMALVEILDELPRDHPGYGKVLAVFQKLAANISAYQTKSGLWRHLVDRADCFEETSGSAYVVYAIAKGVNRGFLDPIYRDVAMAGWQGIVSMRDADGKIRNVATSVSGSTSPAYYYNNSFDEKGRHFYGPLLLAGVEMMTLYEKFQGPKVRGWQLAPDNPVNKSN